MLEILRKGLGYLIISFVIITLITSGVYVALSPNATLYDSFIIALCIFGILVGLSALLILGSILLEI